MAIYKTVIKRGKHPLSPDYLKPNGVYAVLQILPADVVPEWNVTSMEQWGIVQLGADKKVRRSWNVTAPAQWTDTEVDLSHLKVFYATAMEQQFATAGEMAPRYNHLYNTERMRNIIIDRRLSHYETDIFHRIAEHISRFFSI